MTTETVTTAPEVKVPKIRANSRMALLVELFKSGTTTIEALAEKLKEAEEQGKIVGLKKTDEEFKAKKDINFYKKVVNWYLNQAKHKGLIDAPISLKRLKSKKEIKAEVEAAAEQVPSSGSEVVLDTVDRVESPEALGEVIGGIPTI